jgi:hypothetical protein
LRKFKKPEPKSLNVKLWKRKRLRKIESEKNKRQRRPIRNATMQCFTPRRKRS